MAAAHYRLDNLCAIVDANGLQIDGEVAKVMGVAPVGPKFLAFNWHVLEVDGHDVRAIARAFDDARQTVGRPTLVVARTVKGKGVPFFEHKASYHGVPPSDDELAQALEHLGHA
jgi:transketolase